MPADRSTEFITSVWSSYGHTFMSDGGDGTESCLTCGATYALSANDDDPTRGEYRASNGDEPMECTGDTSMHHGMPDETGHSLDCGEDGCEHCQHDCNCLFCA